MGVVYYQIEVELNESLSDGESALLHARIEKNELFLSPHVRSASDGAAMLETEELAHRWAEACKPVFERRGKDVSFSPVEVRSIGSEKQIQKVILRVEEHSKLVSARMEQNMMAANKKPEM